MNILTHKKTILRILAGIVVIVLLFTKGVIPFMHKWNQQTKEIAQKEDMVKRSLNIISTKDQLEQQFPDLTRKMQGKLSSDREEGAFLRAIGTVAEYSNVHIETMNPLPLHNLGAFNELSVEINLQANLGNLVRFLYQIRKSSVVLIANRLNLEPKSEHSALLKGHLVISTIFLKETR
ncbi:MAG: GspMb/PilO family protein [Candidatus Omnitrophota bacterium]